MYVKKGPYRRALSLVVLKNTLRSAQDVPYDIKSKIAEWLASWPLTSRRASSEGREFIPRHDFKIFTKSDIVHLPNYQ